MSALVLGGVYVAQQRKTDKALAMVATGNAAVAQCRAQARAPGECNIRACDVLNGAHPACR